VDKYLRVFKFMFEVFGMARTNKTLLRPMLYNVLAAVPVSILIALAYSVIENSTVQYVVLAAGLVALYFIDYYNNGLTVALVYDQVTTGEATMKAARARTNKVVGGILLFAGISGLLDLIASYAQERSDIVGKILTSIVYAVWTTATYIVMPAMVIEGLSFGAAFSRSKETMKQDPTQVGTGVIGIALANWVLGAVCMGLATLGLRALGGLSPVVGVVFFFIFFNMYWAVSGFIKITYFTCFYVWASECEKQGSADPNLAPAPLARAMAA
jgi:hypothetical protein